MIASKVTRLKTGDILVKLVDASSPAFSHQPICTRPFSTHVNEKPGLKHWSEIPGPKNTPLIGNFLNVRHPVYDLNRQKIHLIFSYLAEKNGWDMCRVEVPGREPYIFLFCPDLTEKALRFGLYDVKAFMMLLLFFQFRNPELSGILVGENSSELSSASKNVSQQFRGCCQAFTLMDW